MLVEKRVRLIDYASVPTGDLRLVPVASVRRQQRLHTTAARKFNRMRADALGSGFDLRIASGWRPHRWRNRAHYESHLRAKYGSVREGQRWLAFASPHETGLAFDLGYPPPMAPTSRTAQTQRESSVYAWLSENAHRYGITPYRLEPWHWEVNIPRSEWENPKTPGRRLLPVIAVLAAGVVLGALVI